MRAFNPGAGIHERGLERIENGLADPKRLPPNPKIPWQENSIE
jgi:hypothetical protein